jgi:hypothetical protein
MLRQLALYRQHASNAYRFDRIRLCDSALDATTLVKKAAPTRGLSIVGAGLGVFVRCVSGAVALTNPEADVADRLAAEALF